MTRVIKHPRATGRAVLVIYGSATAQQLISRCVGPVLIEHYDITSDAAQDGHEEHEANLPGLTGHGTLPDTHRGRALADVHVVDADMEVKLYLNPRRFRAEIDWTNKRHRDYSDCPDGWIPMTADALATEETHGHDHVLELKTGAIYVEYADNWQVLTIALAFYLATQRVPPFILLQAMGPKQKRSGVFRHRYRLGASELIQHRRRLITNMKRIDAARALPKGARLPLVTGEHCTFCDVQRAGRCPAFTARLAADATGDLVADFVTARLRASAAKSGAKLAVSSMGNTTHVTPAGKAEPVTEYTRKIPIANVDAAIAVYPGLADYVVRSIPIHALDEFAKSHGSGRIADRIATVTDELANAGALEFDKKTSWKVTPPSDLGGS